VKRYYTTVPVPWSKISTVITQRCLFTGIYNSSSLTLCRYMSNNFLPLQGGYVFVVVCLFVCLFVSRQLCAKTFQTGLHDICREGWQWANEQTIKFWWRSGSRIQIRIRMRIGITTLVRRALAEVCAVPGLLVTYSCRNSFTVIGHLRNGKQLPYRQHNSHGPAFSGAAFGGPVFSASPFASKHGTFFAVGCA